MWASLPIASSPEHCLPNYPVLVHRLASLLRASFRPRLAAGVISPLRFAITSRPSRCEEDLHLQAVDHARHTMKKAGRSSCPAFMPRTISDPYILNANVFF